MFFHLQRHDSFLFLQDSLAISIPPKILADSVSAQHLILEFWRGTAPVGIFELPIHTMLEAAAEKVRKLFSAPA